MQPSELAAALTSTRSAIGNSAANHFITIGQHLAGKSCGRYGRLVAVRSAQEFQAEIAQLRAAARNNNFSKPKLKAESAALADRFCVTHCYALSLAESPKAKVLYADMVCLFDNSGRRTAVAVEMKLSGDNDSKAVAKNIAELSEFSGALGRRGQSVVLAVAIPFSDKAGAMAKRWEREASEQPKRSTVKVVVNHDVWDLITGTGPADEQLYLSAVDGLAVLAAQKVLHRVAPDLPVVVDERGRISVRRPDAAQ